MKYSKLLRGLLVGALALTTTTLGITYTAKAADSLTEDRVGYYTFDDGVVENEVTDGIQPKLTTKGMASYAGSAVFKDGRGGSGKSIYFASGDDGYGMTLNFTGAENKLGANSTISCWMKPTGTINVNSGVLFMGNPSPECWESIAGNGTYNVRLWGKVSTASHDEYGLNKSLTSNEWNHVCLVNNGEKIAWYVNGVKIGEHATKQPLTFDGADVTFGTNNWDTAAPICFDDIAVYKRAITEEEINTLYTGKTYEQILDEEGVEASDLTTAVDKEQKVGITCSAAKSKSATITYEIDDTSIATVDEAGNVKGIKRGTTTLTVKVQIGSTIKTDTCTVTVTSLEDRKIASFSFEDGSLASTGSAILSANAIVKGLGAYAGNIEYSSDTPDGSSKSIKLGNHGLKLNTPNIGDNFTVSAWYKPDSKLLENQAVMFLGYHDPQQWVSVAGNKDNTSTTKFWAKDDLVYTGWTTLGTVDISEYWHNLVITGDATNVALYLDGKLVASKATNHPLSGDKQDIYIGVTNWDAPFAGLVDCIDVYDVTFSLEDINKYNKEILDNLPKVWCTGAILNGNSSLDKIETDISLPAKVNNIAVTWVISDESVIGKDGKIKLVPLEDIPVTVTGKMTYNGSPIEVELALTVKGMDKTELNALIEKVKQLDKSNLDADVIARINADIAAAEKVSSWEEYNAAMSKLKSILSQFSDIVVATDDPFVYITEPKDEISLEVGDVVNLFDIPDAIIGSVDVEYTVAKPDIAKYAGGTLYASKEGKTIVTAKVTSLSDGWCMEYSTAVNVGGETNSDLSGIQLVEGERYVYTGNAITPAITVYDTGRRILAKSDYTVKYSNNKNAGTAVITITGKGNYDKTITKEFTIEPRSIGNGVAFASDFDVTVADKQYNPKSTKEQISKPTIKYGKLSLKESKDYTLKFLGDKVNPGVVTVKITGIGNYTGTATATYRIYDKTKDFSKVIIDKIPSKEYTGSAIVLSANDLHVYADKQAQKNNNELKQGIDYVVTYKNNVKKGTATAIITGKGDYEGYGKNKSATFKITAKPITDAKITIIGDTTYTGSALKPAIVVMDGSRVISTADYKVSYSNNKDAADASAVKAPTVVVTGKGNYALKASKTFSITTKSLAPEGVAITIPNVKDSGKGITEANVKPVVKIGKTTLKKGKDYDVVFTYDPAVSMQNVTINFKGNYSGSADANFRAYSSTVKMNLEDQYELKIADVKYTRKALKPKFSVVDKTTGKAISSGAYTVEYLNNTAISDDAPTVKLTGKGDYVGTISGTFRIYAKDISKLYVVKIADEKYTGSQVKPAGDKVIVCTDKKNPVATKLTEGVDYKLSYGDNIKKGSGTVFVEGIGEYGGSKKVTFKIVPKLVQDIR